MNNFISFNDYLNLAKNGTLSTHSLKKSQTQQNVTALKQVDTVELNTKLEQAKKQNGLIEKIADKIKGATKLGFSSKKIQKSIEDAKNGTKTVEEVKDEIKNYRRSQENTAQAVGDLLSIGGAALLFFTLYKNLIKGKSIFMINKEQILSKVDDFIKNNEIDMSGRIGKILDVNNREKLVKTLTDKKTLNFAAAIPAMFVGQFIKENVLKINRIGTKQYKPELNKESMSKEEIKKVKKETKKAKRNANFRNGLTGAINGLTLPIVGLLGPLGVPIYVVVNSLSRYFIGSREDKNNKSINSYIDNISASKITNAITALLMAVPLVKKGQFIKIYEKNAQKVVEELKNAKLIENIGSKGVYADLEGIIFADERIKGILEQNIDEAEKIRLLSNENIFALKFKQIANDDDSLTKALREKCPQTWSLEDAQKEVEKTFGANKYKLKKCVGAGTVAQTFVAKDEKGNDVCIKLIHRGIDKEKIARDKDAFVKMINSSSKSQKEKEFLIKNVENIANGVMAEVDLSNEMEAAKRLAKTVKMANVVKPIEVKNNIYVMERADGISLADFNEFSIGFFRCKRNLQNAKNSYGEGSEQVSEYIKELDRLTKEFKQKIGIDMDFEDLTKKETLDMLKQYQDVLSEQFSNVDVNGKTIHGDIHPGNIFIDVRKLKEGKKCFTLIDTGNTIEQTGAQALRFINLTNYIKNADVDNITEFVLEGATLPDGMTMQKAKEMISKELNEIFFDKETKLPIMTNDSLLRITDSIMEKLGIIPSSTQGNLLKAKKSSNNSLEELYTSYMSKFSSKYIGPKVESTTQAAAKAAKITTELTYDLGSLKFREAIMNLLQQRKNLAKLPVSERLKLSKSPNVADENSENALRYLLKQYKIDASSLTSLLESFGI